MNLRKHEYIFSGILLLSFITIMIPKEFKGIELSRYLWKNRIILTFADDENHPNLIKLKVEMKENECEILNRNLLHFHLILEEVDKGDVELFFQSLLTSYLKI